MSAAVLQSSAGITPRGTFTAGFQRNSVSFDVDFRDAASSAPVYDGDYTVIPEANVAQVLYTGGKIMADNVVVQEIPVWETSNAAGGRTVYIGGVE